MTNYIIQKQCPDFTFWENHHTTDAATTKLRKNFHKKPNLNSPLVGKTNSFQFIYTSKEGDNKAISEIFELEYNKSSTRLLSY